MRRDAALLLAARLVSAGTTLALLSLIGHTRGGADLGLAAIGFALGALLSAAVDAGTGSLLIRQGARSPDQLGGLLGAMLLWRVVSLPVAGAFLAVALFVGRIANADAAFVVAASLAIQQTADLTRAPFIARQTMLPASVHIIMENLIWLAVVGSLLILGEPLGWSFLAGAGVFALSVVVGLILDRWLLNVVPSIPGRAELRHLARLAAPFAAFVVLGVAYTRIDTFLVGALLPAQALVGAGAYFACLRLLGAFEYVPETLGRAAYPRMAKAFMESTDEVARQLRPLTRFLVVLAMLVPCISIVAGQWIMVTLFGSDIAKFAWAIIPLSLVVPIRFLGYLFGVALTSTDSQGRRVLAAALSLVVVAAVDIAFIPSYGIQAAVIGTVAASLMVFGVYTLSISRLIGRLHLQDAVGFSLLAAAPAIAAGLALAAMTAPPLGGLLTGIVYLGVVLLRRAGGMPVVRPRA
jgi:O-antigen/teichoic acid export membrane protein